LIRTRSPSPSPDPIASAADALADLGFAVERVDLPWLADQDCTRLSATLFTAEMLPYLRRVTAGREAELHLVVTGRGRAAVPRW
jgi:aspartyl-tRNA(Asn)/glutamyl-tRNA(Gln) amidotransferase subunit A